MGEHHPAAKKVVVQFAPDDLGLTRTQTNKLKKLVGARYNPEKEIIKMSSEGFEHAAQNKRYLLNLIDDLLKEAKDPQDTFEDVPLDLRHFKSKKAAKPTFPKKWLNQSSQESVLTIQYQLAEMDAVKAREGTMLDGKKIIDNWLQEKLDAEQKLTLAAEADKLSGKVPQHVGAAPLFGKSRGIPRMSSPRR